MKKLQNSSLSLVTVDEQAGFEFYLVSNPQDRFFLTRPIYQCMYLTCIAPIFCPETVVCFLLLLHIILKDFRNAPSA